MGMNKARDLDPCHCLLSAPPRFSRRSTLSSAQRMPEEQSGIMSTAVWRSSSYGPDWHVAGGGGKHWCQAVKYTINQAISGSLLATSTSSARVAPRVAEGFYFRGFKTNIFAGFLHFCGTEQWPYSVVCVHRWAREPFCHVCTPRGRFS